jgi:hypothetical protein
VSHCSVAACAAVMGEVPGSCPASQLNCRSSVVSLRRGATDCRASWVGHTNKLCRASDVMFSELVGTYADCHHVKRLGRGGGPRRHRGGARAAPGARPSSPRCAPATRSAQLRSRRMRCPESSRAGTPAPRTVSEPADRDSRKEPGCVILRGLQRLMLISTCA